MAYIGKQPVVGNFVKLDAITTSATATYNLLNGGVAYFPQTANNCIVSLNGVIQSPTSAYTISGSTIVFDSALTSDDSIDFILVLGDVLNIGTPSDSTVGFAKVTSNLITGATAETSIDGADSVLIYDDSATALRKMTRTNFIAGGNTPALLVKNSSLQSLADDTIVKVQFNTVEIDTASAYDNVTNYRFTVPSGQGGRYFFYSICTIDGEVSSNVDNALIQIRKNNVALTASEFAFASNPIRLCPVVSQTIVDLVATDYIEVFAGIEATDATGGRVNANSIFGGYKLIS
jgi:hypothetical protein